MNYSIIRNILGKLLILVAILLCFPLIVSLIYQEGIRNYLAFIIPIVILCLLGFLMNIRKAKNPKMMARDGVIIVGLSWLLMSLAGCEP